MAVNTDIDFNVAESIKAFGALDRFEQILLFVMFSSVVLLAFNAVTKFFRRLILVHKGIQNKLLALQKYIFKNNKF